MEVGIKVGAAAVLAITLFQCGLAAGHARGLDHRANRRIMFLFWVCLIAIAGLIFSSVAKADCGHFFRKQHVAVVQQVVAPYYPPVYYAAGQDLQAEALAAKVAHLVEQKLSLRQSQLERPVTPNAFAKCVSCHSGATAAAGLVLDGSAIDCHTYFRWGQMAGQGKHVPAKMAGLIDRLTPEEKGAINDALLDLVATKPPPPPEPAGGLE